MQILLFLKYRQKQNTKFLLLFDVKSEGEEKFLEAGDSALKFGRFQFLYLRVQCLVDS